MATRSGGDDNWFDRNEVRQERELAFETSEERLPWLESDDDGDEPATYDTGRLIGFALIMLVTLLALVAGIWFVANRGSGSGPAPDGSLIAAPESPYKERPDSPGGKTFAGTGDTSYAVGAGKEIDGRLAATAPLPTATATPAPTPSPAPSSKGTPKATPTAAPAAEKQDKLAANAAALPAGTAVQVGAYSSRADAEAGWQRLAGQTDALSGVSHRVVAGRADIGTVYRLQAVGGDKANAQALCGRLKSAGIACQVK